MNYPGNNVFSLAVFKSRLDFFLENVSGPFEAERSEDNYF